MEERGKDTGGKKEQRFSFSVLPLLGSKKRFFHGRRENPRILRNGVVVRYRWNTLKGKVREVASKRRPLSIIASWVSHPSSFSYLDPSCSISHTLPCRCTATLFFLSALSFHLPRGFPSRVGTETSEISKKRRLFSRPHPAAAEVA